MTWVNLAMLITLFVLFVLLYRSTKRQEEIEDELARYVAGAIRRDSKGRFAKKPEEE